ncbi:MAG: hypothetical protein O4807_10820 [Trichodesmium sp. St19_bin2]|nr:hypothetical protein [Trichodesmium sp. St19_bin2]
MIISIAIAKLMKLYSIDFRKKIVETCCSLFRKNRETDETLFYRL